MSERVHVVVVAGDGRVNEQFGLMAMHTLFVREHNTIEAKLKEVNPHWDGETLYQVCIHVPGARIYLERVKYMKSKANISSILGITENFNGNFEPNHIQRIPANHSGIYEHEGLWTAATQKGLLHGLRPLSSA